MSAEIEANHPGQPHDHDACVSVAIEQAETVCRTSGARLTDTRRRVLELIWETHKPVKAYDLLDRLGKEGRSAKPPTIYRALDFLLEQGLIHRIEALNAFVGCPHPETHHPGYFLICEICGNVAELEATDIAKTVSDAANSLGFYVRKQTVEVFGQCRGCR